MNYLTIKGRITVRKEQRKLLLEPLLRELSNEEKEVVLRQGMNVILSDIQSETPDILTEESLKRRVQQWLTKKLGAKR